MFFFCLHAAVKLGTNSRLTIDDSRSTSATCSNKQSARDGKYYVGLAR